MKSKLFCLILIALMSGCVAVQKTAKPGQGLLKGVDNSEVKVMIRTIDDGEILWVGSYKLGTTATIEPGLHKVSIMCEFKYSWGQKIIHGQTEIDVKPDTIYIVEGKPSSDDKQCIVTVKEQ